MRRERSIVPTGAEPPVGSGSLAGPARRPRGVVSAGRRAAGLTRRSLLGSALSLPAVVGLPAVAKRSSGGLFAGGAERLRVGVVGCGGRGTGAAILAAAADPAVRVVALGDLFTEQVDAAADLLADRLGDRFVCPPDGRSSGPDAYRRVIDAEVDLVILAGPPHVRPLHLETAVAAGRHTYCEKPVAVDLPGVVRAAAAAARGRAAGLSLASGLCFRHDPRTAAVVARLHDGIVGPLRAVETHASLGLPWRKCFSAARHDGDWRLRNWISFAEYSGGHLVEQHVEAIDRGLWMFGDPTPTLVEGRLGDSSPGPDAVGDCPARTAVRYSFADGRVLEASIDRRAGGSWQREEIVTGSRGTCDTVQGMAAGRRLDLPEAGPRRFAAVMERLVVGILAGRPIHDGETLCRSTRAAVLGRMAAESGRPLPWQAADASAPTRPV